jgi:hypothetical protein
MMRLMRSSLARGEIWGGRVERYVYSLVINSHHFYTLVRKDGDGSGIIMEDKADARIRNEQQC